MADGDIFAITHVGRLHGQLILNTMHIRQEGAGAPSLLAIATAWSTQNLVKWLACHSEEYLLEHSLVQRVAPAPTSIAHVDLDFAGDGAVAQSSLPTSMAVTLTKRTAVTGPGGRGRLFMAGVPVTFELDSQVTAAGLVVYGTLCASLEAGLTVGGVSFVSVLFKRALNTALTIGDWQQRLVLRNQRRRQVGHGK